jgi:hypothetical protein
LSSLTNFLVGEVVCRFKLPRSHGLVLSALLSHIGRHSNRVWPSEECLAAESGYCVRTVRSAMKALREKLGIQVLRGDDLHDGPGPHDCPRDLRRRGTGGMYIVNTYDLSPLLDWIPEPLQQVFRSWILGEAVPVEPVPLPRVLPDPFVEQPLLERTQPVTFHRLTSEPPPDPVESHSLYRDTASSVCNVSINVGEAREGLKQAPETGACTPIFQRQILASISKQGKQGGYAALRSIGVAPKVARSIVKSWGDAWCEKAVAYASWRERRQELTRTTAAYVVGMSQTWQQTDGYPDAFNQEWARGQSRAAPATLPEPKPNAPTPPPDRERGRERLRGILGALRRGRGKPDGA